MSNWQRPKAVAQLASFLRGELAQGRWAGQMPGVIRLANELKTARNTVAAALKQLEQEGFLATQGHGKGRIIRPETVHHVSKMRVAILKHDPFDRVDSGIMELQHELQAAGFSVALVEKSLTDLHINLRRLENLVQRTNAAAWVVAGGPQEVLNWFVAKGIPVFALFGRRRDLSIAGGGPDKTVAYRQAARELVARGHRRIILLAHQSRRLPIPGRPEQAFLEELESLGVPISAYNLPDWEPSPDGLIRQLNESYRVTPPTAFLVDEAYLFHAVKHQLAARGIRCPEDVSLICTDPDHTFAWCRPSIAHIHWDNRPLLNHALSWATSVRQGKEKRSQLEAPAELIPGGTMGSVRSDVR